MCINEFDISLVIRTVLLGPKMSGIDRFEYVDQKIEFAIAVTGMQKKILFVETEHKLVQTQPIRINYSVFIEVELIVFGTFST